MPTGLEAIAMAGLVVTLAAALRDNKEGGRA